MKKSKEMSKLIFHVLDKKIIILFFIFIIALVNTVYSEGSLEDLEGFQPSANYGGDGSINIKSDLIYKPVFSYSTGDRILKSFNNKHL